MKTLARTLVTAALSLIISVPVAHAADITLDGYGFYKLAYGDSYLRGGAKQSGRYRNLGADFYRRAQIGMDYASNNSATRSGDLSFELWALPYYGATSGPILMTSGLRSLRGGRFYRNLRSNGSAISLDEYQFPDLSIWEFTASGWIFRDSLTFSRKDLL
jgi:hypothetical protein